VLDRSGRRGRLRAQRLPPPLHLLWAFARYPHLSLGGKFRVAKALRAAASASGETISFETWLQRNDQNDETRRAFWNPFFIPALNAPFDQVSAEEALFTLRTAFLGDPGAARFGYSRVPLAHLAAAAAKTLDVVHLSTPVFSVKASSGVTLSLSKGDVTFDAAIVAVSPRALAKMLGDAKQYGVAGLDGYVPYPILDVHLWHDCGPIGFAFAAVLDSPLQWIFEKSPGYLSCSFSAADEYMRQPTPGVEAFAWNEVRSVVPQLRAARLTRSAVTRNPEATWLPRIGMRRAAQRTSHPSLAVAGSWTQTGWLDTMESAIRSGILAASAIAQPSHAEPMQAPEPTPA
jgi:hydroxysqualene dehydroxylase